MVDTALRLSITLLDIEPAIWRRVEVPLDLTLKDLHAVIQAAMGWTNSHLYQFHVGREIVAGPGAGATGLEGPRTIGSGRVRLAGLISRGVKRFLYVYDMGDDWRHEVRVEKVISADPLASYPRFVDGAGRCPPEDIGGIPGFDAFLEAMSDFKHPDHEELSDWYGGPFDPAELDKDAVRKRLARIAARLLRSATRTRH